MQVRRHSVVVVESLDEVTEGCEEKRRGEMKYDE
jgi:hypothetical protein